MQSIYSSFFRGVFLPGIICCMLLQVTFAQQQYYFIENRGQWHPDVQYLAKLQDANAWITKQGIVYDVFKLSEPALLIPEQLISSGRKELTAPRIKGHIFRMEYIGNNPASGFISSQKSATIQNYFLGKKHRWQSNVPLYAETIRQALYTGVDIRYYFEGKNLRYDYLVTPNADPTVIRFTIKGTDGSTILQDGSLQIATSLGNVVHGKLLAYQDSPSGRTEIACNFKSYSDGTLGLDIGKYDPVLPLVIDPLIFSTYVGGGANERLRGLALDAQGNAIIVGLTHSGDYPTTSGAYDVSANGAADIVISKLKHDGSTLLFSTFLGGSRDDGTMGDEFLTDDIGIALTPSGSIIVTGYTASDDFPTTPNAYDTSFNGGVWNETIGGDVFVTKLNNTGSQLEFSTYIGGYERDGASSLAIDPSGNIAISGVTLSTDFPTTEGAYSRSKTGYVSDMFILKLSGDGSQLLAGTYFGSFDYETSKATATDANGSIYIAGFTNAPNFPKTSGGYYGFWDIIVAKFNPSLSQLVYSKSVGGSYIDNVNSLHVDASGQALFLGYTESADFPFTPGAFDSTHSGTGNLDITLTRINAAGTEILTSTFLGGSGADYGYDMDLDAQGNILITGVTTSSDYPLTPAAFDSSYGNDGDVLLSKLNNSLTNLLYSTYIGSNHPATDRGFAIEAYSSDAVVVAGETMGWGFPTTPGAYDVTHNGELDNFILKLDMTATSVKELNGIPQNYALEQNFPNPFNPSTVVRYSVPKQGHITLKLFNLMGEEVAVLLNCQHTPGWFEYTFDGTGLASGTYFYQLITDECVLTKKLLLIK